MSWEGTEILDALDPQTGGRGIDRALLDILHSKIRQFRVEFLLIGKPTDGIVKPHVVFALTLQHIAQVRITKPVGFPWSTQVKGRTRMAAR